MNISEKFNDPGYTVFGVKINEEGTTSIDYRIIPVKFKKEYIERFKLIDQYKLPSINEVDEFITEKTMEIIEN